MSDLPTESPLAEQEICVDCGLCCDGTLFDHAVLLPGEKEKEDLPEKIVERYKKTEEKELFVLPCAYFMGKCTIYDQKKAHICSAFRCELLGSFSEKKVSKVEALKIVNNALKLRAEIYELYEKVFGQKYSGHLRAMCAELGERSEANSEGILLGKEYEKLRSKYTIFDILLTKNFRSYKDFESMTYTKES